MTGLKNTADRLGIDPRALIGLMVLVGGLLVWVMAFTGGLASLFSGSTTVLKADFASAEDIVSNDPVRIDGVQVGSVSEVTADPGGRGATVTMNLDAGTATIYRNASASIVWRTALGANDAIRIDPGTPAAGALGQATIPQSQDSNQVELDQITQVLHGGAQSGTQTTLREIPQALADPTAPAQAFSTLAHVAPDAAVGLGALRGEVQDTDLKALVRQAGRAVQALDVGTGAAETQQFVSSAASTLSSVAASPAALQDTISGLARVIPRSQPTFATLDQTLTHLDPLMAKLTPEVGQVQPTLKSLHPVVVDADTLLRDADPLLRNLNPTVKSLATTADVGVPVINSLAPSLVRLRDKILPGLAKKYPEEGNVRPYEMIGSVAVSLNNIADSFDTNGGLVNLTLGLEEPQAAQILPCTADFSGADFLVCQSLSAALGGFFGGGSSLLQTLGANADGAGAGGFLQGLLKDASHSGDLLKSTESVLARKFPKVARYLFSPDHGARP